MSASRTEKQFSSLETTQVSGVLAIYPLGRLGTVDGGSLCSGVTQKHPKSPTAGEHASTRHVVFVANVEL